MTLRFGKNPIKIQKKYIAFFGIVPMLLATALIQVPCPECGGTGTVSSTGMANVIVTRLAYTTDIIPIVGCNTYVAYNTSVNLTVLNTGGEDANGYITLALQDATKGTVITTQDVTVAVAAGTQVEYNFNVTFRVYIENPPITNVVAQVDQSDVPCKACNGTGKIPLNSWPFINIMKDSLKATQRNVQPWTPPVWTEDVSNL